MEAPGSGPGVLESVASVGGFIWNHPSNRGRRIRQLARAAEFQLRGRLLHQRMQTVIGTRSRMWVTLHRTSATKALYANPPDVPEMLVWRRRLAPGDLFVDIGANVGSYTLWAAELGADVIAVEAAEDTFRLLTENIALNGYAVQAVNAAAAASPGTAGFSVGLDSVNHLDPTGETRVRTVTVDDLVGDRRVAGMKVDVEGFEMDVLRGCAQALAERRIGLLQLEWNAASVIARGHDRSEVADLLHAHGYELLTPDAAGQLAPSVGVPPVGPDVFACPRTS